MHCDSYMIQHFKQFQVGGRWLNGTYRVCTIDVWNVEVWCMVVGTMAVKGLSKDKLMFQQGDLVATKYKNNF
jgi:hypothetical protein